MPGLFPRWTNVLPTLGALGALGGGLLTIGGVWYYFTPKYWEVGYMPTQPGSGFNHQIHAGKLGIDCRYCHSHIEESKHANVPTVKTCYGCHEAGKLQRVEEKTQFVRDAYETNQSIPWRQIHVLPDYVSFPHAVHVSAGVSCYSCHGQIKGMPVVAQAEPLSMGWCLSCHENPEANLVPRDRVTDLVWLEEHWFATPVDQRVDPEHGGLTPEQLAESLRRDPPKYCGACHY